MIYFSPSKVAFFDEDVHGRRRIEVVDTDALEAALAEAQSAEFEYEAQPDDEEADADELDRRRVIALRDFADQKNERINQLHRDPPMKTIENPDCLIPDDAIKIVDKRHAELMEELSQGKRLAADEKGQPIAVEPPFDIEEALAAIRQRRDSMLAATDWTQVGDAPLTAARRKLWAEHRQALRELPALVEKAVKAGKAPDAIPFPEAPAG